MKSAASRKQSAASRPTSSTASRRAHSRQSTVSAQSNTTQLAQPSTMDSVSTESQHAIMSWGSTIEGTLLHRRADSAQFVIDPALRNGGLESQSHQIDSLEPCIESRAPSSGQSIFAKEQEDPINPPSTETAGQHGNTGDGSKRKKGSATSQVNDNELRRLFRENQGRDLHDVAQQVMRDDKGPKSEKSKQIFGLLWLFTNCKKSAFSVPRNRVFASYAHSCGTEKLPPLNPASFGKLVRIIFPGIQTRRLGIRGLSKYHYVELSLVNDVDYEEQSAIPRAQSVMVDALVRQTDGGPRTQSLRPQLPADTALFPDPAIPQHNNLMAPSSLSNMASTSLYLQTTRLRGPTGTEHLKPSLVQRPLKFPITIDPRVYADGPLDGPLELPSIYKYLPAGADEDAVNSLISVYRSHCNQAIDNFRFCKTEKMCDSYKSLIGLLTVPGQKLLAHPQIAEWIMECDWLKYRKMIPMLDLILLTQVPRKAMAHLEYVGRYLCLWIRQFFQHQPEHIQDAMLGPTNIFVSLLGRFMRVNQAALEVSPILMNITNREQLWIDWVAHVKPLEIVQNSLRHHGHTRLLNILTQEVRHLLSPLGPNLPDGDAQVFGSSLYPQFGEDESSEQHSPQVIIPRLVEFLVSLAVRFPHVDARTLLNHIDVVGSNISRNLTFSGSASMATWWRIKMFIDEMSYWLAEKGGFLDCGPETIKSMAPKPFSMYSSAGVSINGTNMDAPGIPILMTCDSTDPRHGNSNAYFEDLPIQNAVNDRQISQEDRTASVLQAYRDEEERREREHRDSTVLEDDVRGGVQDDSGIGMADMDEFGMDSKFNTYVEGVHGSDPADVVVC